MEGVMERYSAEKKEYIKPELIEYENLNEITAGLLSRG